VSCQNFVNGVASVPARDELLTGTVVNAPLVSEFSFCIENKEMGSRSRAVGSSNFLGFAVIEVGKIKFSKGGADLHVLKRIAEVGVTHFVEANGFGAIWLDGQQGYTAAAIVIG
jgi:hypothetical protein